MPLFWAFLSQIEHNFQKLQRLYYRDCARLFLKSNPRPRRSARRTRPAISDILSRPPFLYWISNGQFFVLDGQQVCIGWVTAGLGQIISASGQTEAERDKEGRRGKTTRCHKEQRESVGQNHAGQQCNRRSPWSWDFGAGFAGTLALVPAIPVPEPPILVLVPPAFRTLVPLKSAQGKASGLWYHGYHYFFL